MIQAPFGLLVAHKNTFPHPGEKGIEIEYVMEMVPRDGLETPTKT